MTALRSLMASAKTQLGYSASYDENGAVRHVTQKPAASVSRHSLLTMEMPAFATDAFRTVHIPLGMEAGKRTKLSDVILAGSRAGAAGAKLLIIPAASEAVTASNGEVLFTKRETHFDVVQPAEFALIADGDDLGASTLPVHRAKVDLDIMPSLGFRVELSRQDQKSYAEGQLADAALVSIAMGIARAADQILFSAIVALSPAAFSLADAAAAGFEISELRAIVGAAAAGAAIDQEGTLRAAGILAELTPDTSATLVGAFNRAAVAVHEEITLTAERIDVNGGMVLTCWANMQALLPFPGAFWTVSA